MTLCVVVVLDDRERLERLRQRLSAELPAVKEMVVVGPGETALAAVERLDPSAGRRRRQRGDGALVDAVRVHGRSHLHPDHRSAHL